MIIEEQLRNALKQNNNEALHKVFERIYKEYGKLIFSIIFKHVNNREDVEELTQDVFLKFFNNITKTEIRNVKYYLVTSANNLIKDYLKKKDSTVNFDESQFIDSVDYSLDNYGSMEIINDMKKVLTDFEIVLIIEHVLEGLSFKELSIKYGKPISTLLNKYRRAIKKMRKGGIRV